MKHLSLMIYGLLFVVATACRQQPNADDAAAVPTDSTAQSAMLTPAQADSLQFRLTHHYSVNFNFMVTADSLLLVPRDGDFLTDTCIVRRGDFLVVAAIRRDFPAATDSTAQDSVWLKVASSQRKMGWIAEQQLLRGVVPDDPVSQLLHCLQQSHATWAVLVLSLLLIAASTLLSMRKGRLHLRFTSFASFYPTLLLLLCGIFATLNTAAYTSVPEFLQEYYFHPTLNPLLLPPLMSALLTGVWLIAIVFIAVCIDAYSRLDFLHATAVIVDTTCWAAVIFIVFWYIPSVASSCVALSLLTIGALWLYFRHIRARYRCGNCGRAMRRRGICPACGTHNE